MVSPVVKSFKSGEYLIREEDSTRTMYILKSGRVKLFRSEGKRHFDFGELGPGDVVGELSFVDGAARTANVIASETVEAVEMTPEEFDRFTATVPIWLSAMVRALAFRLRIAVSRIERNPQEYMKSGLCSLLTYFCTAEGGKSELDRSETVKQLQNILRVSPSELDEALRSLQKKNLIELSDKSISVRDLEGLEKEALELKNRLETANDF